jgi:sporulation protein YlmC with PRC-barrel domain
VTISIGGMANIASTANTDGQQKAASASNSIERYTATSTLADPAAPAVPPASVSSKAPIEISSLLGNKVVTDAGTMVGDLSDVMVDWVDLTITGYEVHMGGVFTKAQEFVDTPGVRYGNKLVTLPAELLNHPK